jgi:hypothetical protein
MMAPISKFFQEMVLIQQSQPGKPVWQSKRFWLGVVFPLLALLAQTQTRLGWLADPGTQVVLLIGLNFVIGLVTKSPTGFAWALDNPENPAAAPAPRIDAGPPEAVNGA